MIRSPLSRNTYHVLLHVHNESGGKMEQSLAFCLHEMNEKKKKGISKSERQGIAALKGLLYLDEN